LFLTKIVADNTIYIILNQLFINRRASCYQHITSIKLIFYSELRDNRINGGKQTISYPNKGERVQEKIRNSYLKKIYAEIKIKDLSSYTNFKTQS